MDKEQLPDIPPNSNSRRLLNQEHFPSPIKSSLASASTSCSSDVTACSSTTRKRKSKKKAPKLSDEEREERYKEIIAESKYIYSEYMKRGSIRKANIVLNAQLAVERALRELTMKYTDAEIRNLEPRINQDTDEDSLKTAYTESLPTPTLSPCHVLTGEDIPVQKQNKLGTQTSALSLEEQIQGQNKRKRNRIHDSDSDEESTQTNSNELLSSRDIGRDSIETAYTESLPTQTLSPCQDLMGEVIPVQIQDQLGTQTSLLSLEEPIQGQGKRKRNRIQDSDSDEENDKTNFQEVLGSRKKHAIIDSDDEENGADNLELGATALTAPPRTYTLCEVGSGIEMDEDAQSEASESLLDKAWSVDRKIKGFAKRDLLNSSMRATSPISEPTFQDQTDSQEVLGSSKEHAIILDSDDEDEDAQSEASKSVLDKTESTDKRIKSGAKMCQENNSSLKVQSPIPPKNVCNNSNDNHFKPSNSGNLDMELQNKLTLGVHGCIHELEEDSEDDFEKDDKQYRTPPSPQTKGKRRKSPYVWW